MSQAAAMKVEGRREVARCVNTWVRDLLDSGRMAERLDYWLAQPVK
jgi:hypothetical protein